MKTVWKYSINSTHDTLSIPEGGEVLCIQNQRSDLCLWVLVDPTKPPTKRAFQIVGTGCKEVPDGAKYIGTIQRASGDLIWHCFEVPMKGATP